MSEQKHTPETWTYRRAFQPADGAYDYAIGANVGAETESYQEACIAECFGRVSEAVFTPAEANARRIVACVNALAGIPTEELEGLREAGLVVVPVEPTEAMVEAGRLQLSTMPSTLESGVVSKCVYRGMVGARAAKDAPK